MNNVDRGLRQLSSDRVVLTVQSAPMPLPDYSRTTHDLNEEIVILRELFVRRKPPSLRVLPRHLSVYSSQAEQDRKG